MDTADNLEGLFNEIINLLFEYGKREKLSDIQIEYLSEIISRLKSSQQLYLRIVRGNKILLDSNPQIKQIRKTMTEENVNRIMHEQAKVDPNLSKFLESIGGRLFKQQSTEISSYNMNNLDSVKNQDVNQIKKLHMDTESFYNSLWLIKERLNKLPRFKIFNPSGVRDVRNQLITHTDKPNSGAYIFSFGVATNGPLLRPSKPIGSKAKHDRGFDTNTNEFLTRIKQIIYVKK